MTRNQLPDSERLNFQNDFTKLLDRAKEAHNRSKKAWHIGPVSLCNRNAEEKERRGLGKEEASINEHDCLKWLGTKKPRSVIYVCFGTTSKFPDSQLREIANGLESSGQDIIWVVRKDKTEEEWLPEGFESRIQDKGLIIRGWASQVLILDHESIGGFVTHCGWNSVLEGISAGLPMVTWPIFADQFYNEKLITDVLRIGVGVGAQQWVTLVGDYIKEDAIAKAVCKIMVMGEEMRSRAEKLGVMAKKAVDEGGSSYKDMNALIEELRTRRASLIVNG